MVKSAIIFSDKNRNQKRAHKSPDQVSLSRDEYRNVIREAYQEGRNDALKEGKPRRTETRQEPKKKVRESYDEWQKENIQKKGEQEAIQTQAKKKAEDRQRFKTITARHEIELMHKKSVFPFSFFPDTLIIDTTKVTVAHKQLFATEHITTIPLKDISDVTLQTVMFLATLSVLYMPQTTSPGMARPIEVKVENMHRYDAIKAKEILKGVLVAKAEEIDIANLTPEEVVDVLQKFGQTTTGI